MHIRVEPKVNTSYHRGIIDRLFLARLEMFIVSDLVSQLAVGPDHIHGTIMPSYNDERYCGPNSAVKDFYSLKLSFLAGSESVGTFNDDISYDTASQTFGPRGLHSRLLVTRHVRHDAEWVWSDAAPGRDSLMHFSVCPMFNPGPRYAGAKFSASFTSKGGVLVYCSLEAPDAVESGFVEAIRIGIAEYARKPPRDLGPMPSGQITIEEINMHKTDSDNGAFRIVGAFAARAFHQRAQNPHHYES